MTVSDVGEFGLIERLVRLLQTEAPAGLEIGNGDDAAAWRPGPNLLQVATTDALVENVHYKLDTITWRDLGWKAMAVNVSDVAGMGATPRYALISLGLRGSQPVADLEELYRGIREHCEAYGVAVVGGNVASSATTFVAITVVGEGKPPLLSRAHGRAGDKLVVTGWLGSSLGGLRLLTLQQESGRADLSAPSARALLEAHRRPRPRVREALYLAEQGVTCGMDVSDGLLGDADHICEASRLGATLYLDALPVHPALEELFPERCRQMAVIGGEDYELLCAVAPEQVEPLRRGLQAATGTPLSVVGELHAPSGDGKLVRVLDADGGEVAPEGWSWRHF